MRKWVRGSAVAAVALTAGILGTFLPALSQAPAPAYKAPRSPDGKTPRLDGIWQANNEANWDLRPHAASQGPVYALGAEFSTPPGLGVIEGGEIPYLPAAAAQQKKNYQNRLTLDPEIKCYMGGVPRSTYMPYPFQIVQNPHTIMMVYEFAGAVRSINMDKATKAPADSWMGWSNGHWEGDTLVVDVNSLIDQSWLDRAGDFHSDQLHVVERYTPRSADTLMYEATIEDPKVFSKPWKISMPLYRRVDQGAKVLEYKCSEFAEEMMYGQYRKVPLPNTIK
ncbi:MAG TPA: hypothetical protein VGN17_06300 [Bryobacteraceae bacterium]|jgi:hypothetical protein